MWLACKSFRRYGGLRTDHRHFRVWQKLKQTNLDLAYPLLSVLYASRQGRPARDPVSMLRSCLAMMECGVTSFDVWVKMMHDEPYHSIISGFDPQDIPGVGTFYDFQDRLLQRQRQSRTTPCRPRRRRDKRDKASHHRNKNDLRPHSGIVNRLVDRILRGASPTDIPVETPQKLEFVINRLAVARLGLQLSDAAWDLADEVVEVEVE